MARGSSSALATLLAAVCVWSVGFTFCRLAFVPQSRSGVSRTALRATEEKAAVEEKQEESSGPFSFPKPDLGLINNNARMGQTFDQDKRGNVWAFEQASETKENAEPIPAWIYFPVGIALTFGAIIFFGVLTGNDPRFGGSIGDGSFSIGD